MLSYVCVCVYNLVQLKSKLHHTGTHLCYRQALLFRHILLTGLSFPQENVLGTFLQRYDFTFLSFVRLKLGNWKWL